MKKELIVTAKSVEEAKAEILAELNLPEEKIAFEVVEEAHKGFLGIGSTDAKVKATYEVSGVDVAMNFLRKTIENMGLNVKLDSHPGTNDDVVITVDGDTAGQLIGHHGDTMDALQYLANLAANKKVEGEKREYVKITLDVEGYRAKREATLRELARRKAEKVLKYKKSVMLEPMNPYERRIIHSEIQGIKGVTTNSIGADANRRVVIFLEEDAENMNFDALSDEE